MYICIYVCVYVCVCVWIYWHFKSLRKYSKMKHKQKPKAKFYLKYQI